MQKKANRKFHQSKKQKRIKNNPNERDHHQLHIPVQIQPFPVQDRHHRPIRSRRRRKNKRKVSSIIIQDYFRNF